MPDVLIHMGIWTWEAFFPSAFTEVVAWAVGLSVPAKGGSDIPLQSKE